MGNLGFTLTLNSVTKKEAGGSESKQVKERLGLGSCRESIQTLTDLTNWRPPQLRRHKDYPPEFWCHQKDQPNFIWVQMYTVGSLKISAIVHVAANASNKKRRIDSDR